MKDGFADLVRFNEEIVNGNPFLVQSEVVSVCPVPRMISKG